MKETNFEIIKVRFGDRLFNRMWYWLWDRLWNQLEYRMWNRSWDRLRRRLENKIEGCK